MGLSVSQVRLLSLTQRKGDVEYNMSIDSMEKLALTREQSELSSKYYAKLHAAKVSFYANGKYNTMNYNYLMGYGGGIGYSAVTEGKYPLKENNSMILTDSGGQVVMSKEYANALKNVLGASCMDGFGRGGTFSKDKIPEILAEVCTAVDADEFRAIIENKDIAESSFDATEVNFITGESGNHTTVDNTKYKRELIEKLVDFYYPIFHAASANGWTTEYNQEMAHNENYVSDGLLSGFLQLAEVNEEGGYDPDASLSYFVMSGEVQQRTDSDVREEITAWYNAEKERIAEKENYLDLEMRDLSTELEAINAEMDSLKSIINDAIESVFDWGSS